MTNGQTQSNSKHTKRQDNLPKDLKKLLKKYSLFDEKEIIADFVRYITKRDSKVFDHAYRLGKAFNGRTDT